MKHDFYWTNISQPHSKRRQEILNKYPEVRELFGPDIKLAVITILLVVVQIISSIIIPKLNFVWYILYAYFVGATITHALFLAIHEITHNLAFKKQLYNNWLALVANIPIVFPYAMSFKLYHTIHHKEQGKHKTDVDIPSELEVKVFRGIIGKFFWAVFQILFYAFRPMFIYPLKLKKWQIINIVFQLIVMVIYVLIFGWQGIVYLIVCDFIAGSLHPLAGHFISEHYVFYDGQETYSYYGPLNMLTFNVGYHNEHHDFPSIPGTRLPKLKKLAPEYYDSLYYHKSWLKVIFKFITDPTIGLYSRVKRK